GLHLKGGVDMNGDGQLRASVGPVNPQSEEFSVVYFNGSVDLVDPTTSPAGGPKNKNDDGLLTMSELISGSPLKVFQVKLSGGALLRAAATIDFSTLGGDLGNILPSISTKILVDFGISWLPGSALSVAPPQVVI